MSQPKEYLEIHLPVRGFDPDVLTGWLYVAGCLGIQELSEQQEWIVYFEEGLSPDHLHWLWQALKEVNPDFELDFIRVEKLPFQDWNQQWRKFFQPFEAAPGLWIRPSWKAFTPPAGNLALTIEPEMAFGTGHHETTRLMLEFLVEQKPTGLQVLDVGCGSGILAIAAEKLGADWVVGVDIDPLAVQNARKNVKLNQCRRIAFVIGDPHCVKGGQFSLILANLYLEILLALNSLFGNLLTPNGHLLLSGFFTRDVQTIQGAYEQKGFVLQSIKTMNEWAAVRLERKP